MWAIRKEFMTKLSESDLEDETADEEFSVCGQEAVRLWE